MSLDEIQSTVLEVLREVQTLSGRSWTGLDPTAKPIGGLDGFDSLSSVEATVMVEEKLRCRDLEVDSIFISEDGTRALTVKEIAQRISKLLASDGGKA
jgi:acyl carrier protein